MAASAHDPNDVRGRFAALEQSHTKVVRIDKFMERKAAEKKAREAN